MIPADAACSLVSARELMLSGLTEHGLVNAATKATLTPAIRPKSPRAVAIACCDTTATRLQDRTNNPRHAPCLSSRRLHRNDHAGAWLHGRAIG
jgi:hypothetical protein